MLTLEPESDPPSNEHGPTLARLGEAKREAAQHVKAACRLGQKFLNATVPAHSYGRFQVAGNEFVIVANEPEPPGHLPLTIDREELAL